MTTKPPSPLAIPRRPLFLFFYLFIAADRDRHDLKPNLDQFLAHRTWCQDTAFRDDSGYQIRWLVPELVNRIVNVPDSRDVP